MNEKLVSSLVNGENSQLMYAGTIASIIFGVVMLAVGVYVKQKKKSWWIYLVLIGAVGIVFNVLQLVL